MAYIELTQKTDGVSGWALGVKRYHEYSDSLDCATALAAFMAMSPANRLANSTLVEPSLPSGKKRVVRDCSGGSTADTAWQLDTDDGTDGYSDSTGSPGGNTGGNTGGGTVNDPGSETNVTYYTSASGDDGGTK